MTYATNGVIGTDFTVTTAGTTTNGENAKFTLGLTVKGSDNTEWTYVQAGAAIAQYDCVAIDENFQAVPMTATLGLAGHNPGFAQVAFSDNDLGWVATSASGNITCNILGSCAADVQLYTSGTAGSLDDTSASQSAIRGVVAITANSTTAAATSEIIAINPSTSATP